jgi:hypothetical protein
MTEQKTYPQCPRPFEHKNEPHSIRAENAPKILDWIKNRGGIAVWHSLNLSNPGMSWTCPVNDAQGNVKTKPYGEAENEPSRIITSTDDVLVHTDVEVKRLKVHTRMGKQGLMVKLTDHSTMRVHKAIQEAGSYAYHLFDYDRQEAVIFAPDGNSITLTEWAERKKT